MSGGLARVLPRTIGRVITQEPWIHRGWERLRRWSFRLLVLAMFLLLVTGTMIRHRADVLVGTPSPNGSPDIVYNEDLLDSPVVATGDELTDGVEVPPGTVVLTFDDGPDPVWTDEILAVLDRYDVRATFFMIGAQVAQNPDVARRVVAAGHEIGNHTQYHFEMGRLDERQIRLQLDLARLAIIDATGVDTDLYRPPYSGRLDTLNDDELRAAEVALDAGYRVVNTDSSPPDYDPTVGIDELVESALPPAGGGAMITLHDGGGERSRTVEMLGPYIERLEAAGYRFATVGDVVAGGTGLDAVREADSWDSFRAETLGVVITVSAWVERVTVVGALAYLALYAIRLVALVVVAVLDRRRRRSAPARPAFEGRVSVIVPAFNEAVGIADALRSIEASDHPDLEILVIDDGSTDDTAEIVRSLELPRTRVVSKPNGGKASALNHGIALATGEVLVMIDGDTILEPDTVTRLVAPFGNPIVGAVSGNPKIGNPDRFLARLQASEYLLASSLERRLLAPAGLITTVPGAVGAWRRSAVQEAGRVATDTLAEDTDLTITIGRGGWRVEYEPGARAWTEAPSTLGAFYRQRIRWTFGTLQSLWKHRAAVFDRGSGAQLGRFGMPYMLVSGYLLAAMGPLVDAVLLANLYLGNWRIAAVSWLGISLLGLAAGLVAARLDGDPLRDALRVPLQQIVYRPIMHVVALSSLRRALMGQRQTWGAQERTGGLRAEQRSTVVSGATTT